MKGTPATTKAPPIAGGEKSLNNLVQTVLRSRATPRTRAAVAVDMITQRVERTYPEVMELPAFTRWCVPSHLIHPSLRVSA